MKTFKEYLTEAGTVLFAGWILPDGTIQKVPFFGHEKFVKENPELFDLTPKQVAKEALVKKLAIANGAVRVHVFRDKPGIPATATIGATKQAMYRNRHEIEEILEAYKVKTYHFYEAKLNGDLLDVREMGLYESVLQEKQKFKFPEMVFLKKRGVEYILTRVSRPGFSIYRYQYVNADGNWEKANMGHSITYPQMKEYLINGAAKPMTQDEYEQFAILELN